MDQTSKFLLKCYVDLRWKRKLGRQWKIFFEKSIIRAQNILSCLLLHEVELEIFHMQIWRREKLTKENIYQQWERYREYYADRYPEIKGSKSYYPIHTSAMQLLSMLSGQKDWCNYFHLGFVSGLYALGDYSTKQRLLRRGGIALEGIPIVMINGHISLEETARTISHELLHQFGAEHAKRGIMNPKYPIDISHLNRNNRRKVLDYLGA